MAAPPPRYVPRSRSAASPARLSSASNWLQAHGVLELTELLVHLGKGAGGGGGVSVTDGASSGVLYIRGIVRACVRATCIHQVSVALTPASYDARPGSALSTQALCPFPTILAFMILFMI